MKHVAWKFFSFFFFKAKSVKNDIKAASIDSLLVTSHPFYLTTSSKLQYEPFTIIHSEENQQILMFEKLE